MSLLGAATSTDYRAANTFSVSHRYMLGEHCAALMQKIPHFFSDTLRRSIHVLLMEEQAS